MESERTMPAPQIQPGDLLETSDWQAIALNGWQRAEVLRLEDDGVVCEPRNSALGGKTEPFMVEYDDLAELLASGKWRTIPVVEG